MGGGSSKIEKEKNNEVAFGIEMQIIYEAHKTDCEELIKIGEESSTIIDNMQHIFDSFKDDVKGRGDVLYEVYSNEDYNDSRLNLSFEEYVCMEEYLKQKDHIFDMNNRACEIRKNILPLIEVVLKKYRPHHHDLGSYLTGISINTLYFHLCHIINVLKRHQQLLNIAKKYNESLMV